MIASGLGKLVVMRLVVCASIAFVASAAEAFAGDELDFSATAAIVSDYVIRGVSQTNGDPAVQGAISVAYGGFAVSVWASNVSFADAELDFSGSYAWDALASSFVVGAIYYAYPVAPSETNYWEGFASWSHSRGPATFTTGVYVSPEYTLESGLAVYSQIGIGVDLIAGLSFNAQGGRQWIEDNAAAALPDYWRWSAGLAYELEPVTLMVVYEDADIPAALCARNICGPQILGGISLSF